MQDSKSCRDDGDDRSGSGNSATNTWSGKGGNDDGDAGGGDGDGNANAHSKIYGDADGDGDADNDNTNSIIVIRMLILSSHTIDNHVSTNHDYNDRSAHLCFNMLFAIIVVSIIVVIRLLQWLLPTYPDRYYHSYRHITATAIALPSFGSVVVIMVYICAANKSIAASCFCDARSGQGD